MMIRAGGETWLVEEHDSEVGEPEMARRFMEVTFRTQGGTPDRVEMRWVPRSARLTPLVARRLFELAGERVWRDSRTGTIHRVHLVDEGADDRIDAEPDSIRIRFRWVDGEAVTGYRLGHPLGLATRTELETMLDEATAAVATRA